MLMLYRVTPRTSDWLWTGWIRLLYPMLYRDKGKSFIRAKFHIGPLAQRYHTAQA